MTPEARLALARLWTRSRSLMGDSVCAAVQALCDQFIATGRRCICEDVLEDLLETWVNEDLLETWVNPR